MTMVKPRRSTMNSTRMFILTVLISLAIAAQKGCTASAIENPFTTFHAAATRAHSFFEGRSKSEENSQRHSSLRRIQDDTTIDEATVAAVPPVFVGDNSSIETTYPNSDQLDIVYTTLSPSSRPSQDELSNSEDEDEEGEPLTFESTLSPSAAAGGNGGGDVNAPVPTPSPNAEDGNDEEYSNGEDEDEEGEPLTFESTLSPSAAAAGGNGEGDVNTPVPTPSPNAEDSNDEEFSYGEDEDEEGEPLTFESTLSPSAAAGGNGEGGVKAPFPTPYPTYVEDSEDEFGTGYPTYPTDGDEIYGWGEEGSPWEDMPKYPTESPTPKPTSRYVPKESGDPLSEETELDAGEDEVFYHGLGGKVGSYLDGVESPQEMETDKNLQIVAGTLLASFIVAMLISAHLVMQYPDGLCAGFCRLTLKFIRCFVRTLCLPCRAICCKGSEQAQSRRTHAPMRTPFPTDLELA